MPLASCGRHEGVHDTLESEAELLEDAPHPVVLDPRRRLHAVRARVGKEVVGEEPDCDRPEAAPPVGVVEQGDPDLVHAGWQCARGLAGLDRAGEPAVDLDREIESTVREPAAALDLPLLDAAGRLLVAPEARTDAGVATGDEQLEVALLERAQAHRAGAEFGGGHSRRGYRVASVRPKDNFFPVNQPLLPPGARHPEAMLRTRPRPLLAELHAHTTWSDGELSVGELVDLYGRTGFDVLCITDHVVRTDDPWLAAAEHPPNTLELERHGDYLAELEREAARALHTSGLLLVPGLELTYNDLDPARAAHAVAVGLRDAISVDEGIGIAIEAASAAGAALVAAHPFDREPTLHASRLTRRFACDPELAELVHRFELFNRTQLFGWVADAGLPAVASGDFHVREHLAGWKTLIPCSKDEQAVVTYLRSPRPVYLTCLGEEPERLAA